MKSRININRIISGVEMGILFGWVYLLLLGEAKLIAAPVNEPSIATESPAKQDQPTYDLAADAKRKASMSPEEVAWETVLEENLGDFYLPRYKAEKLAGKASPFDFVRDEPKFPRVLLIGDSISCGYTRAVRQGLASKANVHRAPANCGSTSMGLKSLPVWLGTGRWDVIHFNFGIWDRNTTPEVYSNNLVQIVRRLEKTGAKLIWARTTPPASVENGENYSRAKCEELNRIADGIMKEHGIQMDDLCSLVEPRLAELQIQHSVHFKPEGYELMGRKVADIILVALNLQGCLIPKLQRSYQSHKHYPFNNVI